MSIYEHIQKAYTLHSDPIKGSYNMIKKRKKTLRKLKMSHHSGHIFQVFLKNTFWHTVSHV